jgi:hypothetical protein
MKSGKTQFEPETERQSMEWRHDIPKEAGRQEWDVSVKNHCYGLLGRERHYLCEFLS